MTSAHFRNVFFGWPANRNHCLRIHGITHFAGIPAHKLGWSGFVNALGDHFHLDEREFSCHATFIEALSSKLEDYR